MDRISFDIFTPDGKKFHLTPNWLMLGLWIITISVLYFAADNIASIKNIVVIWVAVVVAIYIFLIVSSYFTHSPLFGNLNGKIVFENDSIIVNQECFILSEITNLDFTFNDFYDKKSFSYHSCNPRLSQGVDNYITFIDKLNQTHTIYFQMMGKHSSMALYDFINEAVRLNAMSYLRASDLIGDENVVKPA